MKNLWRSFRWWLFMRRMEKRRGEMTKALFQIKVQNLDDEFEQIYSAWKLETLRHDGIVTFESKGILTMWEGNKKRFRFVSDPKEPLEDNEYTLFDGTIRFYQYKE